MTGSVPPGRRKLIDKLLCRREEPSEDAIKPPKSDIKKEAEKPQREPLSYRELFRYATTKDLLAIFIGMFFSVVGGVNQPVVIIMGGRIVSIFILPEAKAGNDQFVEDVTFYLVWIGICGVLALVSSFLQLYLLHRGTVNLVCSIRREFMRSVCRQDADWFDKNNSGAIITQLNDHINRIEDGLGNKIGLLTRVFSMFFSSIIICLIINWQITLIALTMGPISAATMGLMSKFLSKPFSSLLALNSEAGELAEECIMNVKTIAACNAQETMVEKYQKILARGKKFALKYYTIHGFIDGMTFFEIYGIIAIALWFGIWGYFNGLVKKPGDVILIVNTISLTGYFFGLMGPHMMAMVKARMAAAEIYETIDRVPEQDPWETSGVELKDPKGEIVFKDVHFTYSSRDKAILQGISWEVNTGETIAFVGHSGCGKSTSLGLLTRLHQPNCGSITFDGIPIESINLKCLRKSIGIVQQEPNLFNGTILENIILGREEVTEEMAMNAAAMAKAHEFIMKTEKGYKTLLGHGGISLSGGQKQRIAIARAIATNPTVLLLDEATSALDTHSEKIVQAALNKASEGRTTIVIAHRLSTLKDVHRIYVLDKGQIVETGTHQELLTADGIYADLAKCQEVNQPTTSESEVNLSELVDDVLPAKPAKEKFSPETIYSTETSVTSTFKNESVREGFWLLYSNMQGNWLWFSLAMFCTCVRSLEMPFFGVTFFFCFKSLQQTAETYYDYAFWTVFVCTFCGVIVWIAFTFQTSFSGQAAERIVNKFRTRALLSLLHRNIEEFDVVSQNPAACVSILSQHAPNIMPALDYRFMGTMSNVIAVFIGLTVSVLVVWQMGLLGIVMCSILYFLEFSNIFFENQARVKKQNKDISSELAIEIVEHCRSIQLMTVEEHFLKNYAVQQQMSKKYDYSIGFINSINYALSQAFVFFCDMSCYGFATYLIYHGYYTVEIVFMACCAAQISGWSVMYSAPLIPEIVRAGSATKQLFTLIETSKQLEDKVNKGFQATVLGDVNVKNVNFSYPSNEDVMVAQNLTLSAKFGEHIALVGKSGCGKSTLINLLLKYYPPTKGEITIDDNDINIINTRHLRTSMALVGQEPVLFKGSILENVCLGLRDVPIDKVRSVCEAANASKFIEAFPAGYETDVGEKGRALSGGQKQRIAIARALIRDPRILLLDEATSALDAQSEELAQKAINNAHNNRTCVTIAHRLSTIQNCDRIYLIDQGTVIESGTHSELLQLNGEYAKLVKAQQLSTS